MRLVVDANVFLAGFLKNALARELLLNERADLATPEYGLIETRREARELISDPKDAPYLACALSLDLAVWSNDPHFQAPKIRRRAAVFTTGDLIARLKR